MELERILVTAPYAHPRSSALIGKKAWYCYESGYTFEHHYVDEDTIIWKGIGGDLDGYTQEDKYTCFEIATNIYFISWCEETTLYSLEEGIQREGPWPVTVVADFEKLIATVSFINPSENGGSAYIVDQGRIEIKEQA